MLQIDVRELVDTGKWIGDVAKQVPFATALALTRTGQKVKEREIGVMKMVFDRPTPYTLKSLMLTPAKKNNLVATVWFKTPARFSKGHYLEAQIEGGGRNKKGFEQALRGQYLQPADEMKLNQYGNVSAGMIRRILSVLGRAETTAGYNANITARTAAKGKARDFFWLRNARNGLLPGVYERMPTSKKSAIKGQKGARVNQRGKQVGAFSSVIRARGIRPLLIGGKAPSYTKRFPFYEEARRVVDREFAAEFDRALEQAMRTAR